MRRRDLRHFARHVTARPFAAVAAVALATCVGALGGLAYLGDARPVATDTQPAPVSAETAEPASVTPDPAAASKSPRAGDAGLRPSDYARLLGSVFQGLPPVRPPAAPEPSREPNGPLKPETQAKAAGVVPPPAVPLPVPRPAEDPAPRPAQDRPPAKVAALPAPVEDGRSFLDRLFGLTPSAPVAPGTAVYDISARTVVLPSGERLEAHSGLGESLDDPRQVSVRMRGPTPPGIYELTEREKPFHGVRALRLTPVGGNAAVHGRVGLLAHTYMLGPRGDSNGCVSFKDYDRFLRAYLKGEVQRLVVVAGSGSQPTFATADASGSSRHEPRW